MTLTTIFHVFGVRVNRYKLIKHIAMNVQSYPSLIQDAIFDAGFHHPSTLELDENIARILDLLSEGQSIDKLSIEDKLVYKDVEGTILYFACPEEFQGLKLYRLTHDVDKKGDYIIMGVVLYEQNLALPLEVDRLSKVFQNLNEKLGIYSSVIESSLETNGFKSLVGDQKPSLYSVQDDCVCCS